MARLPTLQLLYHSSYAVGRYFSLERIFEESPQGYYETQEASSQGWREAARDIAPAVDYSWGVLAHAYKERARWNASVRVAVPTPYSYR